MWKSAGVFIRGPVTQAIYKSGGPFIAGSKPSEADCELSITVLTASVLTLGQTTSSPGLPEPSPTPVSSLDLPALRSSPRSRSSLAVTRLTQSLANTGSE